MLGTLKVQAVMAAVNRSCDGVSNGEQYRLNLRLSNRKLFTSLSLRQQSQLQESSSDHHLTSVIDSSSPSPVAIQLNQWTFTHRHIRILNFIALTVAISSTWLFCSAIPALLAFKRAAESMEKLMDVTREELPDTMAAVRLSGMEISDLTIELCDLGQELTQGVRNSTRVVRLAEERLRRLTTKSPSVSMQAEAKVATVPVPGLARAARNTKEGIVKSRSILEMVLTITRYSGIVFNFFRTRTTKKT